MKLNLLFIVMDLLTLLAYPILFVHGKLRQVSRSKENMYSGEFTNYWFGRSRRMTNQKTSNMRKTKILRMTKS